MKVQRSEEEIQKANVFGKCSRREQLEPRKNMRESGLRRWLRALTVCCEILRNRVQIPECA